MPTEQEQSDSISREAYERIKRERDEAKAQAAEFGTALKDYARREKARTALKGRVADPDMVADLLTPHLKDTEPDQVAELIGSEGFKAKLAPFQPPAPPPAPAGEEGGGTEPTPAIEPNGFGAGPSPGSDASAPTPEGGTDKIQAGSDQWRRMVRTDPEGLKKAYEENRVVEPSPVH